MSVEAFFFGQVVLGVWRGAPDAKRVWIIVPPFGEEEKSARRTLTDIAQLFLGRGEASLLFSFRGTGDSGGDLATIGLDEWRVDLGDALEEAQKRATGAQIAVLGVRLGASLALQVASKRADVEQVVLIEPLLSGRSFLSQQMMRQKIRAQMTGEEAGKEAPSSAPAPPKPVGDVEDLDGWALGATMKAQLQALDLMKGEAIQAKNARIIQVGPKPEVAPPLRALGERLDAPTLAVTMPPFWNLLDYSDPAPLLAEL